MIKRHATDIERIHLLNTVAMAAVFDFLLTQLTHFPKFYRHKARFHAKGLAAELKPYIEGDLALLYEADDLNTEAMYDRAVSLLKEVMNLRPEQWQLVAYAAEIAKTDCTERRALQSICEGFKA